MKRAIQITKDGSTTIAIPEKNITYHSTSGAIGESLHVFIDAGLRYVHASQNVTPIHIFEMGFGTGLNALLSWQYALAHKILIDFTSIETQPISVEEVIELNYGTELDLVLPFDKLHRCAWNEKLALDDYFSIEKQQVSFEDFVFKDTYNVIFFDAFAPNDQPELWTKDIFDKLYQMLLPNGVLVTYCSKGEVRRNMIAAGFTVEKLKGYANKWEMLRASKA